MTHALVVSVCAWVGHIVNDSHRIEEWTRVIFLFEGMSVDDGRTALWQPHSPKTIVVRHYCSLVPEKSNASGPVRGAFVGNGTLDH